MDIVQLMPPFLFRVREAMPCFSSFSSHRVLSVYSDPLSLADVASQLGYGYDELDAVTVEDMCMEVSTL